MLASVVDYTTAGAVGESGGGSSGRGIGIGVGVAAAVIILGAFHARATVTMVLRCQRLRRDRLFTRRRLDATHSSGFRPDPRTHIDPCPPLGSESVDDLPVWAATLQTRS